MRLVFINHAARDENGYLTTEGKACAKLLADRVKTFKNVDKFYCFYNAPSYEQLKRDLDAVLSSYGYDRKDLYYTSPSDVLPTNHFMANDDRTKERMKMAKVDETTVVFFCPRQAVLMYASHLLNIPYEIMEKYFTLYPSSVTVFASEERFPGNALIRCQYFGDISHLSALGGNFSTCKNMDFLL